MPRSKTRLLALASLPVLALSACAVGPNYKRPPAPTQPVFKEAQGNWAPAAPADALDRGPWWNLFDDPDLDQLEQQVGAHNQTLLASEEAYQQARALVAEARANFFPTVTLDPSFTETGGGGRARSVGVGASGASTVTKTLRSYSFSLGGSWAPDVWGKVRRQVEAAGAQAQASAATAANVRLTQQTELAADYLQLRTLDEELRLYDKTVKGFETVLQVSENQYKAGTIALNAVDQAKTQLYDAQGQSRALNQQRQQLEHAIAVLIGEAPGNFSITPKPYVEKIPAIPVGLPSDLLERRPDVAEQERLMKAQNAQIGVAVSAYFPNVSITGSYGYTGGELGSLFSASNALWSFGGSAAETVFQGGARFAAVKASKAAYREQVANYRQTVLTAFQQVEDQLIAVHMLDQEVVLFRQSSAAADEAEKVVFNQYQAGTASSTDLVVAEQTALAERRNLITAEGNRLAAAVSLIEALGGGWNVKQLPKP